MMSKGRCNRKTTSQVAPNSYLHNEDSKSDDPGPKYRATISRSLANETVAETLNKVAQRFYWFGMARDVQNWVASCSTYNARKQNLMIGLPKQHATANCKYAV